MRHVGLVAIELEELVMDIHVAARQKRANVAWPTTKTFGNLHVNGAVAVINPKLSSNEIPKSNDHAGPFVVGVNM